MRACGCQVTCYRLPLASLSDHPYPFGRSWTPSAAGNYGRRTAGHLQRWRFKVAGALGVLTAAPRTYEQSN